MRKITASELKRVQQQFVRDHGSLIPRGSEDWDRADQITAQLMEKNPSWSAEQILEAAGSKMSDEVITRQRQAAAQQISEQRRAY
ncbi:MAG: hypothetical protein HOL17_06240 [Gammaproteobacteria bacterium]|jgi:hypothetical protein|nr:hypothetical protein [Gammaproteobacteria bacterium]MBT4606029.1 hypothetical protein [Thiotrichales bacterium]MBT7829781.1 hypothetical protein [Candidatus Neomarinimicrobiota bacterium]MBT4329543.1 hypothetical protein [Gammaproteobacteria bacterium]MBT5371306.1 hypothetical protein [Gammaproteobacteria bacterium]